METKIKVYLREWMFRSTKACSLEDLAMLRYFSEIPSWDLICRDYYRLQKNVGNQMRSPLLFDSIVKSDRPRLSNEYMHDHRPWSSRSAELKLMFSPSRYSRKTCFQGTRSQLAPGLPLSFEPNRSRIRVPTSQSHLSRISRRIGCLATILIRGKRTVDLSSWGLKTPWVVPHSGEISVYRLPSDHPDSRQTDPGFEFPVSKYPWHCRQASQLMSFLAMFFWPGDKQTNRQTNKLI